MKSSTVLLFIFGFTNPLFSQSISVTQPDDTTPAAAIESFFNSLLEGDAKRANTFLLAPERMADYCRIQVELYEAFRQLGDVSEQQFGNEGMALRAPLPASLATERLKKVQPEVDGNRAVWKSNPKAPMTLHKVDGQWKLNQEMVPKLRKAG